MDIVIMAGGRATRLHGMEKALLNFLGRTLLDIALKAAVESRVGRVVVAVSPHSPRTAAYARPRGVELLETPGRGYHEDIAWILRHRHPFLTLAVDLPFVRGTHLAALAEAYRDKSLAGALPTSLLPEDVRAEEVPGEEWRGLMPVGINVVDEGDASETFLFHDPLLAYNVNSLSDLKRAEKRARGLRNLEGPAVRDADS